MELVARFIVGAAVVVSTASLAAAPASVSDPANEPTDGIVVYGRALAQIGTALSGSAGTVGYRDFENKSIARVGELVENVPGMIATQHSGSGKANQYFLRGFNLDHGTDFAGFIDGAPINLPTHGHGQGYMDLNFLIPELIDRIDYSKGPYLAAQGDFAAVGTAAFSTVRALPQVIAEVTVGSYGYYRALAAGSASVDGSDLLLAVDATRSKGPWVLDERLRKTNIFTKFSRGTDADGFSLGVSFYRAGWHSTDQVPQRAIASGWIDRYGNIDPYLGGRTTRAAATFNIAGDDTRFTAYALFYDFALTSNFTYFLDDPVNGDEFQQRDRRGVFGGRLQRKRFISLLNIPAAITIGADGRYDLIGKVGLYNSVAGVITSTVRQDRVGEFSGALYGQVEVFPTSRLRMMLGLRGDLFGYNVTSQLAANSGHGSASMLEPKATLAWHPIEHLELYANYGQGYHSNDVRGATIRVDPASGDPASRVGVLVRARSTEIGARVERQAFTASLVLFHLLLGSELVFAGDSGSTEPNAGSRRFGGEATLFWKPASWLTLDGSAALTHARFRGMPRGEDRIPNSVGQVLAGGLAVEVARDFSLNMRLRHFGAAPLVEDGSARSRPTTLVSAGGYWTWKSMRVGIDLLNVLDSKANDITYYYRSRLPGEPAGGLDDYHLHPVEPRQVRVSARLKF
ncbi:MAG: TonB-dependent receptor [Janthinobacterium lividum]